MQQDCESYIDLGSIEEQSAREVLEHYILIQHPLSVTGVAVSDAAMKSEVRSSWTNE